MLWKACRALCKHFARNYFLFEQLEKERRVNYASSVGKVLNCFIIYPPVQLSDFSNTTFIIDVKKLFHFPRNKIYLHKKLFYEPAACTLQLIRLLLFIFAKKGNESESVCLCVCCLRAYLGGLKLFSRAPLSGLYYPLTYVC